MIDAKDFTDYHASVAKLEEMVLFGIAVANKKASSTSILLEKFLDNCPLTYESPFDRIKSIGSKEDTIQLWRKVGGGAYNVKGRGFWWIANSNINLRTCTTTMLEQCPGIGFKTSRFFILHTRRDANPPVACPDTHIRKWLASENGDCYEARKYKSPTNRDMIEHEKRFLELCEVYERHPADLDLEIWKNYAK